MCRACIPFFTVLVIAALGFATSPVEAQLSDFREHARRLDHLGIAVGAEASLFIGAQGDQDVLLVAPSPVMGVRLWRSVLEVAVPIAVARREDYLNGTSRKARVGNLWAAVSYLPDCSCGLSRLTLGMGAPTARADDGMETQTLALANATHGAWDSQLWIPNLLPLVVGYQTLLPLGRRQLGRLTGEGDVIVGLPGHGRDTDVGLQWAGEASVGRSVRFGGRLGATYWPTFQGDNFQSSLGTFLRYGGPARSVGARFVMNLDGPDGFSFSPGGVWGVHLTFVSSL